MLLHLLVCAAKGDNNERQPLALIVIYVFYTHQVMASPDDVKNVKKSATCRHYIVIYWTEVELYSTTSHCCLLCIFYVLQDLTLHCHHPTLIVYCSRVCREPQTLTLTDKRAVGQSWPPGRELEPCITLVTFPTSCAVLADTGARVFHYTGHRGMTIAGAMTK